MKKFDAERFLGRVFLVVIFSLATFIAADRISVPLLKNTRTGLRKKLSGFTRAVREPKPYVMFSARPHAKMWGIQLNDLGYPDAAPSREKPDGEFRIIMLGGSSVFRGNPSLPRLLQYQFEKDDCPRVKVYNFGVVSSVTGMELARLVFEVVDYHPDIVVSYSGFNDVDEPFEADPRPGYPYNFLIYENNPILDSDIKAYPLVPLALYGSNICRHVLSGYFLNRFVDIGTLRRETGFGTAAWEERIADAYVSHLRKSNRIARAFGAEFMAFFQPSLYFKESVTPAEAKMIDPARRTNSIAIREKIHEKLSDLPPGDRFFFRDMADYFGGTRETVFKDRVHLSQLYRPTVARDLYGILKDYIRRNMPQKDLRSFCPDMKNAP